MKSITHRRKLLLFGLCVAIAVVAVCLFCLREKEPSYNGRTLSEWLDQFQPPPVYDTNWNGWSNPVASEKDREEAADAIRQIGTNGLPFLLKWMAYEHGELSYKLGGTWYRWPAWMRANRAINWVVAPANAHTHSEQAREAFQALGPIAAPAVDELSRRINLTNSPMVSDEAVLALGYIGPAAVPVLYKALANYHGGLVLESVKHLGTNAEPLLPIMVEMLRDTNYLTVEDFVEALGEMDCRRGVAVPALATCLTNDHWEVRMKTASALQQIGPDARMAVPSLVDVLNDPDPNVRNHVTNALRRIAPDVLANGAKVETNN